jgi:hypothetical protein
MKIKVILISFVIAGAALAGFAFAQAPNPAAEAQWQRYLANHPGAAAGLANNPGYLANHPGRAQWLQQHPDVASYARHQGEIGGWDRRDQWHDRNWWVHNDPDWVRDHHPEWAERHADRDGDGDWDEHHHWRARNGWVKHHPDWVRDHHPGWYRDRD